MNFVLTNMLIGANFNSHAVLSVRDPGGPILRSISPTRAMQGETVRIAITGNNLTPNSQVILGDGITMIGTGRTAACRRHAGVDVRIRPTPVWDRTRSVC